MLEEYKLYNRYSSSKNKKSKIHFVEPVGYFDSLNLIKNAAKVITDSGGILKEAYFLKKPCIILRDNVELVEAVKHREAILVGSNHNKLLDAIKNFRGKGKFPSFSGDGTCADKIVNIIKLNTLLGAKNGKN
jgi:UDP-GlcNAc3NAcA epimerase